MSESIRRAKLLYNGWLFGLSMLSVAVFLLILKYHRLPYGGSTGGITFTWSYADWASVIFFGGVGIFILIKMYEYGIENNDERWPLVRDLRARMIALECDVKALKEDDLEIRKISNVNNCELSRRISAVENTCPKLSTTPGDALGKILGKDGGNCG